MNDKMQALAFTGVLALMGFSAGAEAESAPFIYGKKVDPINDRVTTYVVSGYRDSEYSDFGNTLQIICNKWEQDVRFQVTTDLWFSFGSGYAHVDIRIDGGTPYTLTGSVGSGFRTGPIRKIAKEISGATKVAIRLRRSPAASETFVLEIVNGDLINQTIEDCGGY